MKLIARSLLAIALTAAAAGAQAPAAAGAAGRPALVVAAQNRTAEAEAARGTRRADARARAGDVLHYRLTFTNGGARPVRNVVLANPVPAGLQYVANSARAARADARLEFAVDGGTAFAARPVELVTVAGRRVERPVPPARYTAVRWTVREWVAPAATVVAEFDALLPATAPATSAAPAAPAAPVAPTPRTGTR